MYKLRIPKLRGGEKKSHWRIALGEEKNYQHQGEKRKKQNKMIGCSLS